MVAAGIDYVTVQSTVKVPPSSIVVGLEVLSPTLRFGPPMCNVKKKNFKLFNLQ